jgi:hypothetical protein
LLSSKDPIAYQQIQAMTVESQTGYTGPILSGDEIELANLEKKMSEQDAFFASMMDDTE